MEADPWASGDPWSQGASNTPMPHITSPFDFGKGSGGKGGPRLQTISLAAEIAGGSAASPWGGFTPGQSSAPPGSSAGGKGPTGKGGKGPPSSKGSGKAARNMKRGPAPAEQTTMQTSWFVPNADSAAKGGAAAPRPAAAPETPPSGVGRGRALVKPSWQTSTGLATPELPPSIEPKEAERPVEEAIPEENPWGTMESDSSSMWQTADRAMGGGSYLTGSSAQKESQSAEMETPNPWGGMDSVAGPSSYDHPDAMWSGGHDMGNGMGQTQYWPYHDSTEQAAWGVSSYMAGTAPGHFDAMQHHADAYNTAYYMGSSSAAEPMLQSTDTQQALHPVTGDPMPALNADDSTRHASSAAAPAAYLSHPSSGLHGSSAAAPAAYPSSTPHPLHGSSSVAHASSASAEYLGSLPQPTRASGAAAQAEYFSMDDEAVISTSPAPVPLDPLAAWPLAQRDPNAAIRDCISAVEVVALCNCCASSRGQWLSFNKDEALLVIYGRYDERLVYCMAFCQEGHPCGWVQMDHVEMSDYYEFYVRIRHDTRSLGLALGQALIPSLGFTVLRVGPNSAIEEWNRRCRLSCPRNQVMPGDLITWVDGCVTPEEMSRKLRSVTDGDVSDPFLRMRISRAAKHVRGSRDLNRFVRMVQETVVTRLSRSQGAVRHEEDRRPSQAREHGDWQRNLAQAAARGNKARYENDEDPWARGSGSVVGGARWKRREAAAQPQMENQAAAVPAPPKAPPIARPSTAESTIAEDSADPWFSAAGDPWGSCAPPRAAPVKSVPSSSSGTAARLAERAGAEVEQMASSSSGTAAPLVKQAEPEALVSSEYEDPFAGMVQEQDSSRKVNEQPCYSDASPDAATSSVGPEHVSTKEAAEDQKDRHSKIMLLAMGQAYLQQRHADGDGTWTPGIQSVKIEDVNAGRGPGNFSQPGDNAQQPSPEQLPPQQPPPQQPPPQQTEAGQQWQLQQANAAQQTEGRLQREEVLQSQTDELAQQLLAEEMQRPLEERLLDEHLQVAPEEKDPQQQQASDVCQADAEAEVEEDKLSVASHCSEANVQAESQAEVGHNKIAIAPEQRKPWQIQDVQTGEGIEDASDSDERFRTLRDAEGVAEELIAQAAQETAVSQGSSSSDNAPEDTDTLGNTEAEDKGQPPALADDAAQLAHLSCDTGADVQALQKVKDPQGEGEPEEKDAMSEAAPSVPEACTADDDKESEADDSGGDIILA